MFDKQLIIFAALCLIIVIGYTGVGYFTDKTDRIDKTDKIYKIIKHKTKKVKN